MGYVYVCYHVKLRDFSFLEQEYAPLLPHFLTSSWLPGTEIFDAVHVDRNISDNADITVLYSSASVYVINRFGALI